jgi:hypothetical protein
MVTNLSCREAQTPLFLLTSFDGILGMNVIYAGSAGYYPPPGSPNYEGVSFLGDPGGGASGYGNPNLSAALGSGLSESSYAQYGQAPTTANVTFIISRFVLPEGTADAATPYAAMGRQPLVGASLPATLLSSYEPFSILDHYDAWLAHTYGAPRVWNISLVGQSSWIREVDGWASDDTAYWVDFNGLQWAGYGMELGFTALNAPANITLSLGTAALGTPNGGSETLTFIKAGPQSRYLACFDLARLAIDLTGGTTPASSQTLASSSEPASSSEQL